MNFLIGLGIFLCWYNNVTIDDILVLCYKYYYLCFPLILCMLYKIYQTKKDRTVYEYYSSYKDCIKSITYYKNFKKTGYERYSYPAPYSYTNTEGYDITYYDNALEYEVKFNNGVKDGYECSYNVDDEGTRPKQRKEHSCYWKSGLKDGEEIEYNDKGMIIHSINWNNGKKNGIERRFKTSCANVYWLVYECNWKNDLKNGTEWIFGLYELTNVYGDARSIAMLERKISWIDGKKEGIETLLTYSGKHTSLQLNLWNNDVIVDSMIDDNYKLKEKNVYHGNGGDPRDYYDYSMHISGNLGDFISQQKASNDSEKNAPIDLDAILANGSTLITKIDDELSIDNELQKMLALFSDGTFFVDWESRFNGMVIYFMVTINNLNMQINSPIYVSAQDINYIYSYVKSKNNSEEQ